MAVEDYSFRAGKCFGKKNFNALAEQSPSATEISRKLNVSMSTILYHLARLEVIGLVESEVKFSSEVLGG
ncbi:helix-turn-helix transcriptional regulator [Candidatus Bathyarchaeota archaeon]|nr:helix-turn-helix transcriptional regulator [Candidatus Bathyarchaeota archaeon]